MAETHRGDDMKCDMDCFNCIYEDCVNSETGKDDNVFSAQMDREIMKENQFSKRMEHAIVNGTLKYFRYNHSEKGKAARNKYSDSDKGKIAKDRYNRSGKGKARYRAYYQRKKERMALAESNQ